MKLNSREFSMWAFDRTIRINKIVTLAAAHECDSATDDLRDLIDESTNEELQKLFGFSPPEDEEGDDELRREWLLESFIEREMYGFVVFAETPVKRHAKDGKSTTYSWGHTWAKTFYVNDLDDELREKLAAWRDEMNRHEKKSMVKAGS